MDMIIVTGVTTLAVFPPLNGNVMEIRDDCRIWLEKFSTLACKAVIRSLFLLACFPLFSF